MFWEDVWIGSTNLKSRFPSLYNLSLKKEAHIQDFGNPLSGDWNLHLRRRLNDEETLEFAMMSHQLTSFSFKDEEDYWVWNLEKSGNFSSRSLTKKLAS